MSESLSRPLGWRSVLGYGAGDIANNFVFAMATFFLLNYYTEVAGIPLVAAGTLLTAVKIYGACTDVVAGRIVDRCKTRWGKFRPFILFGALPLLLLNVAVFSVPPAWRPADKLAYAYVTYALLITVYSFVNISYGSLASAMTQDPRERTRLGASRTLMSVGTASVLTIVVGPALASLHGDALQASLSMVTLAEAGLGTLLFGLCVMTSAEVVPRKVPTPALAPSLAAVRRNRPLLVLCGCALFALLGYTCSGASLVYFARHIVGDPKQFFLFIGIFGLLSAAMTFAWVPALVERLGKKRTMLLGLAMCLVGYLLLYVAARWQIRALIYAAFMLTSIGARVAMSTIWALEADTVEYGEWHTGVRVEGLTYATFSLARKAGQALGVGLPAMLLAWGGYRGGAAMQSPSALEAIALGVALAPALAVLAAFCLMCFYPLNDRSFSNMVREIHDREAADRLPA